MVLYHETIEQFNEDVMQNRIADRAADNYLAHYKRRPGDREYRSWQASLPILNNSFIYAGLKDTHVLVEYELPYSSKRIDVLLFGKDLSNKENVVILELKQWSNNKISKTETEGNVIVNYGTFVKEEAHPSLKVEGYYFHIKDFVQIFTDSDSPTLSGASYAHNYSKNGEAILYSDKFKEVISKFPLFSKEDSMSLAQFLKERLQSGGGQLVFERFTNSSIGPSRKLLDHTSEMINQRQIFNLIDEQIAAYNAIMHKAKELSKTKGKSVIIVKGGPGTGKSVIALETMGELLRQGKKVVHATGSSAFTNTLRKVVGNRARNLFNYFNSYAKFESNTFDVLICDEAHRIRESSIDRFTPKEKRSGLPQIDELLNVAKLSIFFIDEFQIVRPKETGSVNLIKEAAARFGVNSEDIKEFELQTQFRCSGSDSYLQWLDNILGIRETEITKFDMKMEFRIFDNPEGLRSEINLRNQEKPNSARTVAGFCWPWSDPNPDGSLVNDVKIGSFSMPWEDKKNFWKWATDKSGMDQIGTVYTAQGFEFDYIGVIFGNDLVYDLGSKAWKSIPENSHDSAAKRGNRFFTQHLKNTYRVLMSRAHKGVYVYFMDKDTENYFRGQLSEILK